jgi:hypothetical protein
MSAQFEIEDEYPELSEMMKAAKRWILWKREKQFDKDGKPKKDKKVPYYVNGYKRNGKLDIPEDIVNFSTYDKAIIALKNGNYEGLGFALGKDELGNYWQGVDFDKLSEHVSLGYMVDDLQGYVEHSPSGDGVHAIGYGRGFNALGSNETGIEAYCEGRYFTVTGQCAGIGEPVCLADYVEQILKPLHTVYRNKEQNNAIFEEVTPETVNNLRLALFSMGSDNRELWVKMGMALKTIGNNGRALWLAWSATSEAFDPLNDAKTWDSFKPERASYKVVFAEAQRNGWVNPNKKYYQSVDIEEEQVKQDHSLDLGKHLSDGHLLKRLSKQVSSETSIPFNSALLMGLSVYSSMTSRKYCVTYENGVRFPLGIYAVAEQPPGAAKSWSLSTFQRPFIDIHEELPEFETGGKPALFITNATPEGLEVTLHDTRGFFSAVSSEQGLFNALLGASYLGTDKVNNNDILLSGYDGGYVNSKRVGRVGYEGRVCGSITCFAQQGSIETILKASNGTGLSERFLMLSEDHNLGKRDHLRKIYYNEELLSEYKNACNFIDDSLSAPKGLNELVPLKISREGFYLINSYRNEIEPHLLDSGKYAASALRGAAGKVNMQIMKIACNLHLINNGGSYFKSNIDDEYVKAAILIANDLLEANLALCIDKGIIGFKAEYTAIINYLTSKSGDRSEGDIVNSLRNTQPFKAIEKKRPEAIRRALSEMVEKGLLATSTHQTGKKMFVLSH